jgi:hypothetical protein
MAARKKSSSRAPRASTKSKPRAKAKPAEAEVVEVEEGGLGIDEGIILTTTLLLVGAIAFVFVALGTYPA